MKKQTEKGKITALYKRLSHDDGQSDESVSVENQKHILEDYAELDRLVKKLYEANATGKLPDKHFSRQQAEKGQNGQAVQGEAENRTVPEAAQAS